MRESLLHTPEGVRDIYNSELQRKEQVERRIKERMRQYGFSRIKTPTFEYFDIFNKERGTVPSRDMYKFIDRDGETLVLRPDITPQVARCVAKYFRNEELPIRLWYHGNVFVNHSGYQGKLKESTQIGAELVNEPTAAADAEMVALMIDCLKAAGLTRFQVEIGQADFFRALAEEAGVTEEEREELRTLIESKNLFGVEQLMNEKAFPTELKELFLKLSGQFGGIETVRHMKTMTKNPRALAALNRLEQLHAALTAYGKEAYVSYDLGMLNQYNYYTGVVFRAYTYGTGDVVAAGGRYDGLVGQFGKQAPAIGIAVYSDQLLTALARQGLLEQPAADGTLILYEEGSLTKAAKKAEQLRREGRTVTLMEKRKNLTKQDYIDYAGRIGAGSILSVTGTKDGTSEEVAVWNI
ncbi:MAG: ATP phosphoribosyltransferase regulatory subunit [Lachnospiraceae bacterium]